MIRGQSKLNQRALFPFAHDPRQAFFPPFFFLRWVAHRRRRCPGPLRHLEVFFTSPRDDIVMRFPRRTAEENLEDRQQRDGPSAGGRKQQIANPKPKRIAKLPNSLSFHCPASTVHRASPQRRIPNFNQTTECAVPAHTQATSAVSGWLFCQTIWKPISSS